MARYGDLHTNKSAEDTKQDIAYTFEKWGIEEYRILPSKRNGVMHRDARVEYSINDQQHHLSCDRFWEYRTNLRAIYFVLEALRKAQERGILKELARAAIAFLPPGDGVAPKRPWYEVLQVSPKADPEVIEATYKTLAKKMHPDAGGSDEAMRELNAAIEEYRTLQGEEALR